MLGSQKVGPVQVIVFTSFESLGDILEKPVTQGGPGGSHLFNHPLGEK
jgi:hypothetical protein